MATSRRTRAIRAGFALGLAAFSPAMAQVPPAESEIAAYRGLHAAAATGDIAAIARLAGDRAALEARDGFGRTPLHVATFRRQRAAILALLQAGADANALENQAYDAVTIAAVADDLETLDLLLANGAKATNITSPYVGTALIAAAHLGHDGVVRSLIRAGAPLDHVNNLHWTALIEAVVLGDGGPRHQACVKALIEAGARLDLTDRDGRTARDLATIRGYDAMVRIMDRR